MAENPEETDVSLPPADEQRITPPLTDEELAEMEALYQRVPHSDVLRLIADLRARSAEVAELKGRLQKIMDLCEKYWSER